MVPSLLLTQSFGTIQAESLGRILTSTSLWRLATCHESLQLRFLDEHPSPKSHRVELPVPYVAPHCSGRNSHKPCCLFHTS